MMFRTLLAGVLALVAVPAVAQHASTSAAPAGFVPETAPMTFAALSSPCTGTATTSTATSTSPTATADQVKLGYATCAVTLAAGVSTFEFTPQLGRPIRLVTKLTAGSSYSAQVFTSPDHCVTLNQITVVGTTWAQFLNATGTINEDVDTPYLAGITYCAQLTPASGATVGLGVRQ